jgi:peptidoglycan/xylan/chitin deacetylase (PgdA/CDA1 family)
VNPFWKKAASLLSGMAAKSGVTERILAKRRRSGDYRVFILEYHDVSAGDGEPEGTVSRERFRGQLRYLQSQCRLVSLSEAVDLLQRRRALKEDLGVITFDDGTLGNFEAAWPLLKEQGVPATVFVTSGFVDGAELWFDLARRCLETARGVRLSASLTRDLSAMVGVWTTEQGKEKAVERLKRLPPERRDGILERLRAECPPPPTSRPPVTWDHLRKMHASGMEVGCHTVSHPVLSTLSPERQEEEILQARDRIAREIGETPRLFAYPNGAAGDYNEATVEILLRSGFIAACTTLRGSNRPGCDLFQLRRIGIGADSESLLAARLAGLFDEAVRAYLPDAV